MIGSAPDLVIKANYNKSSQNYSLFGNTDGTYEAPEGMSPEDANKYLAGSQMFKVSDIEVFACNYS